MYKSKWNNSKKNSLGCLIKLDLNVNHDQFIKQIIARWQKSKKIFAFLYWIQITNIYWLSYLFNESLIDITLTIKFN